MPVLTQLILTPTQFFSLLAFVIRDVTTFFRQWRLVRAFQNPLTELGRQGQWEPPLSYDIIT
jgi:hypothetical protein